MTKPRSSAQQRVFFHNQAIGHAALIKERAAYLMRLPSANQLARDDARAIYDLAERLCRELRKERID